MSPRFIVVQKGGVQRYHLSFSISSLLVGHWNQSQVWQWRRTAVVTFQYQFCPGKMIFPYLGSNILKMKIILMMTMAYFFPFFQWELVHDCVKAKPKRVVSVSYSTTSTSCNVSYTVPGSVFGISGSRPHALVSSCLSATIDLPHLHSLKGGKTHNMKCLIGRCWVTVSLSFGVLMMLVESAVSHTCPKSSMCAHLGPDGDCEGCSVWFTKFSYSSKHSAVMPCKWGHCHPVKNTWICVIIG